MATKPIPFNRPFFTGKEHEYLDEALRSGKISGDGMFTQRCHQRFEDQYGFHKTLLTSSCTDALELSALLLEIEPGDEVIMPSYTFVSTANAFVLRGARIVFADSGPQEPSLDVSQLEALITPRTKAIVPVHYAGVAVDMDPLTELAQRHQIGVVEDAAHCIESYYKGRILGGIGHLGTYSFHETKNIHSGEGGALLINEPRFAHRAEILREKGTNRSAFFRGEVDKYGWVDVGSSFLPSDVTAALLWAQLEAVKHIQSLRLNVWHQYAERLQGLADEGRVQLPFIPDYATNNAHMFYLLTENGAQRAALLKHLKEHQILAVFHYLPLHKSKFYQDRHDGRELPHCDRYSECLVRLPLFNTLSEAEIDYITETVIKFFKG